MDQEIDRLIIGIRADTRGFARDVAELRGSLEGHFGAGVEKAGNLLESSLVRAIRTGRLGFEDLKRVALSTLAEIASAAIRSGLDSIIGGLGSGGQGGGFVGVLGGLLGLPGRATGGPVSPGRAFMVGERGPEVFVPTSSGNVAPISARGSRDIRIAITVNAPAGTAPDTMRRSSRQVARAVRNALARED